MGQYFIPGAGDANEAQAHIGQALTPEQVWDVRVGGIVFVDPSRTDEECAALFAGFEPTIAPELDRVAALPKHVLTHLQHLRDYRDADPADITNAQTVHVVKDLIRAVILLNSRFETEG